MKWTSNKDFNKELSKLERLGWKIVKNKSIKIYSPDGVMRVVASCTPSDVRALSNHIHKINKVMENVG